MNRVGQGLLWVGLANGVWLLGNAGCSSSDTPGGGTAATGAGATAGSTNKAGNTGFPGGGASGAQSGGAGAGAGGSFTGGGASGVGGAAVVAGAAGTVAAGGGADVTCSTDVNLTKATDCWVGCDPTLSTDNPQGLQGAFYTFGDTFSCMLSDQVCSAAGVCISGTTFVDKPAYTKWGCGIGMELNATGGAASVKQAYKGPATCFKYTLTGSSGGNEVQASFTQAADTTGINSPYVAIPAFTNGKTGTICVGDVGCQGLMNCTPGTTPFDLQFKVHGGDNAGAYNVCLTDLEPVTSGSSTLPQLCGAQGSAAGTADVGKYYVQNNIFPNSSSNKLCVTPTKTDPAVGFTVDSATFATGANLNAYPSVVDGWHFGRSSTDTALPKQLSALASANSAVTYTGSVSKYDAAYDIWVLPSASTATTPATPAGGLEVMIWLNSSSVNPAGSNTGQTFMGYEVWTGTVETWKYVAYRKNGQTSFTGDLKPFITDAATRSSMPTSSYLAGVEFGFELYEYPGTGFAVKSFTLDVK
jgi:Glycosyl hydrolase family 12